MWLAEAGLMRACPQECTTGYRGRSHPRSPHQSCGGERATLGEVVCAGTVWKGLQGPDGQGGAWVSPAKAYVYKALWQAGSRASKTDRGVEATGW